MSERRNKRRVLVLGDENLSCFAVIRALAGARFESHLGTAVKSNAFSFSRYVRQTHEVTSASKDIEGFCGDLEKLLNRIDFDLVIPTNDWALIPVMENRERFANLSNFAIPNSRGYEHSRNKDLTAKMAGELQIPAPLSRVARSPEDLNRLLSEGELKYPLVIKPTQSVRIIDQRIHTFTVTTARDSDELIQFLETMLPVSEYLVQDYAEGYGVGQEFLARDGEILMQFQHERVHEPPSGGGSSYRKGVPMNAGMLECSRKMIEYMNYNGALMIEYKYDPHTGNFALMEINGRYWGSLQLGVSSGQNFPVEHADMILGEAVERRLDYPVERYCRHFSFDLSNAVRHVVGGRAKGGIQRITAWSWLWSLRRVLLGRESWDLFTFSDPLPFLIDNYRSMSRAALKAGEKLGEAARARLFNLPAFRRARLKKWLCLLGFETKIVFVCLGNICRSPFAVELAKTKVNDELKEIFLSAGTHPFEGRPSPGAAIRAAKSFGVDLNPHRSRTLAPKRDELYVVMDLVNYRNLIKNYSIESDRVIPLSFFDNSYGRVEIPDPFGESEAVFQLCYSDIARLIDKLIRSAVRTRLRSKSIM